MLRKGLLLLLLVTSAAWGQSSITVTPGSLLRVPASTDKLQLDTLEVAQGATLLLPGNVTELRAGRITIGSQANILVAPSERPLHIYAEVFSWNDGAQLVARGNAGTTRLPATSGRDLWLHLASLSGHAPLVVDVAGGKGSPGYKGLDGANGESAGCTWGRSSRGHNGLDGGDGQSGGAGGRVVLEVPRGVVVDELFTVHLQGGPGGEGGTAGKPGRGGEGKGCLVYRVKGAESGRPGNPGQAGRPGPDGAFEINYF